MGIGRISHSPFLENLSRIQDRIAAAARRAGRDPGSVELLAVVKYAPLEAVRELLKSREVRWLGENRIQDAVRRREELGELAEDARWRFIGRLQSNKAKAALESFDTVDSLDSLKLAEALEKRLRETGKTLPVLLQVKLSAAETQGGIPLEDLDGFVRELERFPSLRPEGLMAIAPLAEPVESVRPAFRAMREALERNFPEGTLSMGMSRDFELAVEEGATMVRIGSALFQDFNAKDNQGGIE